METDTRLQEVGRRDSDNNSYAGPSSGPSGESPGLRTSKTSGECYDNDCGALRRGYLPENDGRSGSSKKSPGLRTSKTPGEWDVYDCGALGRAYLGRACFSGDPRTKTLFEEAARRAFTEETACPHPIGPYDLRGIVDGIKLGKREGRVWAEYAGIRVHALNLRTPEGRALLERLKEKVSPEKFDYDDELDIAYLHGSPKK